MEKWNIGMMERKNINRGFRNLRVWQDAIELYYYAYKILLNNQFFELKKVISNSIDAAHSISRNIAEGYSRRSLKEYLNFLNIALGSCGEFHSCYYSFLKTDQISKEDYEKLDALHYKLENGLINLVKSLQRKLESKDWNDSFL